MITANLDVGTNMSLQQVTAKRVDTNASLPRFERPLAIGESSVTINGEAVNYSYELLGSKQSGSSKNSPLNLVLNGVKNAEQGLIAGAEVVIEYATKLFGLDRKSVAVVGLSAIAAVGVTSQKADGAAVKASDVAASNLLGDVPGNLWVTAQAEWAGNPDGSGVFNFNFTAFPIGKQVDLQGNTTKTFFYFPDHELAGTPTTITGVGDGTNYMTNRGREFQNVQIEYRGGFNYDTSWGVANDVVIASTTTVVPDSWILPLAPEGAATAGQIVSSAGYDRLRIDGVLQPKNGESYGVNGELSDTLTSDFIRDGSYKSIYSDTTGSIPVSGLVQQGGSGSRVLSSSGEVLGAIVAGSPFNTYDSGFSFLANFTAPGYRNQLLPYSGTQVVPEPGVLGIVVGGAGVLLRRRRREVATE